MSCRLHSSLYLAGNAHCPSIFHDVFYRLQWLPSTQCCGRSCIWTPRLPLLQALSSNLLALSFACVCRCHRKWTHPSSSLQEYRSSSHPCCSSSLWFHYLLYVFCATLIRVLLSKFPLQPFFKRRKFPAWVKFICSSKPIPNGILF
jgi:hypothetical protein